VPPADVVNLSEGAPTLPAMPDLTDRERAILLFERGRWNYAGAKDTAIREAFGVNPWRYQQEVHALIDRPEALQHDPQLVLRLRRLREQRAARRAG
jgi:hypothetical protein